MDIKKIFNAVIGTFGAGLGVHLLNFLTTIVIVRNLPPDEYGIFALIISFSLTLTYLSVVGLPQVIIYFIGKRNETSEKVIGLSIFLTLCIGIIVVLFGLIFKKIFLKSFLKDLQDIYYYLLLIYFFITLIDTCLLSVFRGLQNYLVYNIRRLLSPLLNLAGICFLFYFFKISLWAIVAVFITINIITTTWLFLRLISKTSIQYNFNWVLTKSFFSYGIKSYLQLLIGHFIYQVDIYIIAYLIGAKEVAFYSIAVTIATLLWFLPDTIGTVLFPTLASTKNEDKVHLISVIVCRSTIFIAGLGAVSLIVIGKPLILLFYGNEYLKSINAMLLILPGVVAMTGYKILTRDFSSRNRQQIPIIAAAISLILNVCLNFIWIPVYGIEGASLASTLSYFVAAMILIIVIKKESEIPFQKIFIINSEDVKYFFEQIKQFFRKSNVTSLKTNEDTIFPK